MLQEKATIQRLIDQGEPLALSVYHTYKAFWRARRGSDQREIVRCEDVFRKTINEFIARSLMIFDRVYLREKYGVYQDDPDSLYRG
jgi:hypothetical protein